MELSKGKNEVKKRQEEEKKNKRFVAYWESYPTYNI